MKSAFKKVFKIIYIMVVSLSICVVAYTVYLNYGLEGNKKEDVQNANAQSVTTKKEQEKIAEEKKQAEEQQLKEKQAQQQEQLQEEQAKEQEQKLQEQQASDQVAEAKKQQDLENLWQQAYTEYNSHNYEKCIEIENEIITQDSNFYKAYTIKGIAQCFNGDYFDGFTNLNKALVINPNYGYGRYAKALGLELDAQYDEAINEYNQALQVEQYVWSYYGIASIYGRRGDINNVVKYLTIAISMDSDVKKCAQTEKDYDNVRQYQQFQDLIK